MRIDTAMGMVRGEFLRPLRSGRRCILLVVCLLFPTGLFAVVGPLEQYHKPLTLVLDRYVRREERFQGSRQFIRTRVNYAALKRDRKWPLYIESLARIENTKVTAAPPDDQKAFWINCYNAFVIDAIVQAYPIKAATRTDFPQHSIQSIPDVWDSPRYVAGASLSLSKIKARVLRFNDPRAYMALSDGATDSAALPERPYNPTGLEQQLDDAAFNFCADSMKVRLVHSTSQLHLTPILNREPELFRRTPGRFPGGTYSSEVRGVIGSILPFMTKADQEFVRSRHPKIVYEEFDWRLNDMQ